MNCIFRRLNAADAALALGMNRTFREGFATAEGASGFLPDQHNWLFAAIAESTVIGFAYGCEVHRPNGSKCLYIHEVGVAEAYQRQGIGTAMMTALKEACRTCGIPKFFLWTDQANAGANALYRKVGGEICEQSQGNDRAYWFQV